MNEWIFVNISQEKIIPMGIQPLVKVEITAEVVEEEVLVDVIGTQDMENI